jgi:dTDP-4-amino-4,6-dideoxygalactose transaminase
VVVPFANLEAQHAPLKAEILEAVSHLLETSAFSGGPLVARFEDQFADYCQTRYAIGTASGTHALWLALLALGVGPGDEVITAPNSFIATAEAIVFAGATPVFVDIEEETYNLNPFLVERAITPRTKAIVPVHLYVEDAAQAHGAEYQGCRAGSVGDIGCFSFFPSKNLGACGEAGACVTNNAALRERIALLRDHGQARKYHHSLVGWNGRMDGIQAAILSIKLRHLEAWTERRRAHAAFYNQAFTKLPGVLAPREAQDRRHVYHQYVLRLKNRDHAFSALNHRGIGCGIHYPVPIHLQPAFAHLGFRPGSFPVAELCANEILSLPIYPELTKDQLSKVAREVAALTYRPDATPSPKLAPQNPVPH